MRCRTIFPSLMVADASGISAILPIVFILCLPVWVQAQACGKKAEAPREKVAAVQRSTAAEGGGEAEEDYGDAEYSYAFGKQYEFVVSDKLIKRPPKWAPGSESPPLAPRAAIRAAERVADKYVKAIPGLRNAGRRCSGPMGREKLRGEMVVLARRF